MDSLGHHEWDRRQWLSLMAQAPAETLLAHWQALGLEPGHKLLREAEIGSVMVRGRMGGEGDAFNLGEMTVTRCSVALDDGTVGHGYIQGRSKAAAVVVALCDALLQTDAGGAVRDQVLMPLQDGKDSAEHDLKSKAAATKVDFFTMVRGED